MADETQTEEITTITQKVEPASVVKTTKTVAPPPIKLEHPQERYETKKLIFRTYQGIWYLTGVIEALLVFRIFLKALGANPSSGFTFLVYLLSDPFALPFSNMFTPIVQGNSVFELGTFVGCFVYLILAYAVIYLFQLIKPTTPQEVEENV